MHDGTEDHRRNHHLDQCDEAVAERLQRLAEIRIEISDQYTERDRDENLNIQDLVPPLMTGGRTDRFCGHAASGWEGGASPRHHGLERRSGQMKFLESPTPAERAGLARLLEVE